MTDAVKLGYDTTPEQTQERVVTKRAQRKGRRVVEKNFNALETLQVEYLPIAMLAPNSWNPNRQSDHDFELLLRSMEEDGFTQPILALLETNASGQHVIVDGEHRWRAAAALGLQEIPVVRVDMTPEQARISTIRHNRARGSHDVELEAELLRDLERLGALDIAQDSLMLDDTELERLLEDIPAPEALAAEDFSGAWVPDTFSAEERDLVRNGTQTTEKTSIQDDGGTVMEAAMTTQAIDQQRRREKLIEQAKTEQDKQRARQESQVYRLSLIFSGEEAKTIKAVLGGFPAEKLLELCTQALAETEAAHELAAAVGVG